MVIKYINTLLLIGTIVTNVGCGIDSNGLSPEKIDNSASDVLSMHPEMNASNVERGVAIEITFNVPIDESSIDGSTITLTSQGDEI